MEDDNRSVTSTGSLSSSQAKVACPHCAKDFQKRSVFKHIRLNHYNDFLMMTSGRWIDEAAKGFPLKISWEGKDERGEDDVVTVWVCLATYKTFMTAARANAHFMKDKSSLTIHNRELKALKKELDSAEFRRKQAVNSNAMVIRYREARKDNCPNLGRVLWRRILRDIEIIDMMKNIVEPKSDIEKGVRKSLDRYYVKKAEAETLKAAKCLDVPSLEALYETMIDVSQCIYSAYYTDELFDCFKSFGTHPFHLKWIEMLEEEYYLTTEDMPKVDF
jgi:hypothetical protein